MSLALAGGFLFFSLSPRQKVYVIVVLFCLNYTILPLKQIVQNLLSLTSACKILMSSALNWFLSPCVISMYRYSRRSWKYDHWQGQCFFDWATRSSGQCVKHIPAWDTDAGLGSYIFWIPDERELELGALKTELGENIISLCTFLPGLHFSVTCILFPSFPFFVFFFYMAPDISEVQSGAEKFSLQYGPVSGFGLATAEAKCLEPFIQSHSGALSCGVIASLMKTLRPTRGSVLVPDSHSRAHFFSGFSKNRKVSRVSHFLKWRTVDDQRVLLTQKRRIQQKVVQFPSEVSFMLFSSVSPLTDMSQYQTETTVERCCLFLNHLVGVLSKVSSEQSEARLLFELQPKT